MNKRMLFIVIMCLAILSVISACSPKSEKSGPDVASPGVTAENEKGAQKGTEVGEVAPDFTLTTVEGKEVSLSSLRGQPVMLNFWATWCPPCQMEMPDIQKFFSRKGQDIKVLAVNLTVSEKAPAQVRDFLNARGYTFPVMLDSKGDVSQQYLVRSIPTTFFIDQKGIIRDKHTGPMTLEMMEASLSKLK